MSTEYQIRIYSGTTWKGLITDMQMLQYSRLVNNFGVCQFVISEDNQYAAECVKNYRVEIWRKVAGASWYREENYIIRRKKTEWKGTKNIITVTAVSGNWLLQTRIVAWRTGTANRATFDSQKAETVAKTLVRYNLASDATTANGRVVAGNTTNTVQAAGATGNTIDIACAYDNLLTTLQAVADVGGGDFNMVWTGSVWDFRWYNGQLGTDRTTTLVFALERGNLENPSLTEDWMSEKTLAVVGGQGEEADRNIRTRQGADWSAANQVELFVDARDIEAGATNENDLLDKRGDTELAATEASSVLLFSIAQSENSRYGIDYSLGDLGKVLYAGVAATFKVSEVVVTFQTGADETIVVGVQNV